MPDDVVLASVAADVALKFMSTVGHTIGDPTVLEDADIKALPTTFIEVQEAPDPGRMLIPFGAILIADIAISGAYTNITPSGFPHLWIGTNDGAGLRTALIGNAVNDGLYALSDLLATANRRAIAIVGPLATAPFVTTPYNQGVVKDLDLYVAEKNIAVGMVNASGVLTGGHPDNTLTVFPIYLDIEVP